VPEGIGLAFADPPYGENVAGWDKEFAWQHDFLQDVSDYTIVTPGIINLPQFLSETEMNFRWCLACHISNGYSRGKIGFSNWIALCLFAKAETKVYRCCQDHKTIALRSNTRGGPPHKGRKPRECVEWVANLYGVQGKAVADPFAGTGTTLIVCEGLGFRCITGEISPEYCGRIIRRWESFTGETATPIK
jgi:hypothetical protein